MKQLTFKFNESQREVIELILGRFMNTKTNSVKQASMLSICMDLLQKFELGSFQIPKKSYNRKFKYHEAAALHSIISGSIHLLGTYENALMYHLVEEINKVITAPYWLNNPYSNN